MAGTAARGLLIDSAPGGFDEGELEGLPEPVRRYFRGAVAVGAPLARAARLDMRGRLRLGPRWLPFRGREVLAPHAGFVWAARVAGVISGSDRYVDGRGVLDWRLLGLVRVVHAEGADVTRSAAARGVAEAVWLPTALLPRFGVEWTADDDTHLTARCPAAGAELALRFRLGPSGRLDSLTLHRWGDPDGTGSWASHPFGMDVTAYGTLAGYTIPVAGRVGWFHGAARWPEGEFFRYRLTALHPVESQDGPDDPDRRRPPPEGWTRRRGTP